MSLTSPMPLRAPLASTCALRIASTAAANALSKPKLRSMKWMSLSMVLGMPMTATGSLRRSSSATILVAALSVPSPPTTNSAPRPSASMRVDHLARVLAAARAAEQRAALVVDRRHQLRPEAQRRVPEARDHALEAVAKAEDLLDAVGVGQLQHQPAHHVVDAGAEAAAGDDPAAQLGGVEEDAVARTGELERRQRRIPLCDHTREAVVEQQPLGAPHVVHRRLAEPRGHRRFVATGAERLDLEIARLDARGPLGNGQVLGGVGRPGRRRFRCAVRARPRRRRENLGEAG